MVVLEPFLNGNLACVNTLTMKFFTTTERSSHADWSRAVVYESVDYGNDVTCHTVPVVSFLVFRKNNFTPQHGQRRTKF